MMIKMDINNIISIIGVVGGILTFVTGTAIFGGLIAEIAQVNSAIGIIFGFIMGVGLCSLLLSLANNIDKKS